MFVTIAAPPHQPLQLAGLVLADGLVPYHRYCSVAVVVVVILLHSSMQWRLAQLYV
jgi:hypothetical protein